MIIECKNCQKKFTVRDSDIPNNGRTVQCGNCSTKWLQMPISLSVKAANLDVDKKSLKISPSATNVNLGIDLEAGKEFFKKELTASDGKIYKFLGNQWAELLPSGKSGRLAKKKISRELNKLAGRKIVKKKEIVNKSNQYEEKRGGIGVFSFLIVLFISICAIILFLDTFKNQIIPFWPNLENHLVHIFETVNNIYVIIKDLFNNYK